MDNKNFKYIKGKINEGEPAQITFYSDVTEWRVNDFVYELKYLDETIHPSEIDILINSSGGACVDGITAFAAIRNLKTKTKCINVGLAASMASIIWAAGDEGYMYDYSMLMIHCPWLTSNDAKSKQIINAFKQQLKTIYMKRFGMSEEKILAIMEGKQDEDGTWYSADEAVTAGFLPESHVLKTDKQIQDSVKAAVKGVKNTCAIKAVMNSIITEHQPFTNFSSIQNKTQENTYNKSNNTKMNEELRLICSQLGLSESAKMSDVSAKLIELNGVKAQLEKATSELKAAKNEVTNLTTKLQGAETAKTNLQANLDKANASLKEYRDKEIAETNAAIENLVEDAIKEGKISKDAKAQWTAMAQQNLDMVKETLASIPAREKISAEVNDTPEAKLAAHEAGKSEVEKCQEKVQAIVGEDFHFRKFDD